RFVTPVYDGDTVEATVSGSDVELRNSAGGLCATGTAGLTIDLPDVPDIPDRPLPAVRPPVGEEVLAAGTVLGAIHRGYHAEHAGDYLAQIGEDLPVFVDQGVAHPGWVL